MQTSISHPLEGVVRLAVGEPVPTPAIARPDRQEAPSWLRLVACAEDSSRFEVQGSRPGLALQVERTESGWTISLDLEEADRCYGLGEKAGYLDKRGRIYQMWNHDEFRLHVETVDPLYLSVPWGIVHAPGRPAFGLYLDDSFKTRWDVGATDRDRLVIHTPRQALDLYVVAGPALADVVRRFAYLVGLPPLPPRWALGYHQCRYSYMSADEVRQIARELRDREIPADAIWLDIDYMDGYRVFTFDPERFAEPAKLLSDLSDDDFEVVAIVDPGVKKEAGYPVWESGLAERVYVEDPDRLPLVGEVWPGEVGFPDFVRPEVRAWWAAQHAPLFEAGLSGIWNDMNEPAVFKQKGGTLPEDARHGPGGSLRHAEVHNLYASYEAEATVAALKAARPEDRPFVLTRAGFAGIARHAAVWTGDNGSVWPHLELSLPMLMNLGLSGVSFCGADVGGFQGDCTAELLARWTQVGAFYPFFRNHSAKGTVPQEPWRFGPEIEKICRQAIALRYKLMPYLVSCFWQASLEGLPVFRPLVLEWPDDPEVADLCDQALIGPDLMIAPAMRPGVRRRAVYFSGPGWFDLASGAFHRGGTWEVVDVPLEVMPIFVRAGAILPMLPVAGSTPAQERHTLNLAVFGTERVAGQWFDDDGVTTAYEDGAYDRWRFEGQFEGSKLELDLQPIHLGYGSPSREIRIQVGDRVVHQGPLEAGTIAIAR